MLPLLVPAAGVVLWIGSWLSDQGKTVANSITGVPEIVDNQPRSALPSWVIPTVLVGVGALLLYKTGAKALKL